MLFRFKHPPRTKEFSSDWIEEKLELLKTKIPSELQQKIHVIEQEYFLSHYHNNPTHTIQTLGKIFLDRLNIESQNCTIDFYKDENMLLNGRRVAGLFKKGRKSIDDETVYEYIMINYKYIKNPLHVISILCHEITHLYLYRLGIHLEDREENECLTDLASIVLGFSTNMLNGISYAAESFAYPKIMYSFGYCRPVEYASYVKKYYGQLQLPLDTLFKDTHPIARYFLTRKYRMLFLKNKNANPFIKGLENKYISHTLNTIVIVILVTVASFYITNSLLSLLEQHMK